MRSVNKISLLGVLAITDTGADGNKPVCNFTITTVEEWQGRDGPMRRETVHTCVAFGPIAKTVETLRDGDHIYVDGAMRGLRDDPENHAAEVVCFVAIPVAEPSRVRELVGLEQQQ